MKTVTIVAGLAGAAAAGYAPKHARLHARDTTSSAWPEWDPYTTTTTTSSSSTVWPDWDPSTTTTTTSASSTVWPDWDPATTTTTTSASSTVWPDWDPKTTTTTTASASSWGEWDPASSSSTTSNWSEWDPSTSAAAVSTGWGADPSVCAQAVIYITGEGTWAPDGATTSSVILTSYTTLTVSPTESAAATTWSDWSDPASPSTAWSSASASSWSASWPASSSASSSASWSASPSPSSSGSPGGLGSGDSETWAMTYSPYTSSGGCKDAGTVSSDISAIAGKGFTTVRVYSTDCSTLANVGSAARANNLKIILGIFISSTGISGAEGQVTDIVAWAQWDLVELVVVGNEAVFNGYCSASALAGFISSVKGTIAAAGYSGPVSTTEPIETWLESGTTFCGVIDVVAANLYAFFNAQTTADMAGAFIQSEITELEGICSGKDVYVMETGWPHAGNCNGVACPSPENQATAINSIKSVVGAKVVFFSFEDDAWKSPGQFDVEQYWGCADVFSGN